MKRTLVAITLAAAALVGGPLGTSRSVSTASFGALNPGGVTTFAETVMVNLVYVGIPNPTADVSAQLPETSAPIMRYPAFYGLDSDLGIRYRYVYNHVVAGAAWTQALYARVDALAGAHEPGETLTLFQQVYNTQANNARQLVESQNQWISAAAVERYLADNPPTGVDTKNPTIYFIDRSLGQGWYPHVYVKTNEPDPDTGYNFGQLRSSRKMTAWGGTPADDEENPLGSTRRVWFYDLSAGPESFQSSWNVDDADVDGDGVADYRIPPSWHYAPGYEHPGYPGAVTLGTDLGKVARFVGLDLLFTTSPLYRPFFTADRIPETVDLDVTVVEGWNGVDASRQLFDGNLFLAEEQDLPAGYTLRGGQPFDVAFKGETKNCYLQWVQDLPCYNTRTYYPAFANLFLNWALNLGRILEGDADYEAAIVNYAVGTRPKVAGLLGFADDNYLNGVQSGVFGFVDPEALSLGYGLTTTTIHEYGHHSSMSHPHDGYDSELGDFGPSGETYFAWLGDFSNSMMSYIDLNWDFSQFDRDNSARHHAAGFALISNRVAAAIVGAGAPGSGPTLVAADVDLVAAQAAFAGHNYTTALDKAESAYRRLLAFADGNAVDIDVVQPSTWTELGKAKGGRGVRRAPTGLIDLDERHNLKRWQP
jgi:hypothetical protein